jgi:hypothetical protein
MNKNKKNQNSKHLIKVIFSLKNFTFSIIFFTILAINLFSLCEIEPLRAEENNKEKAAEKYIYIFGGFPDVRFQGAGIVHPHSESNPASLELIGKYDINISFGIKEDLRLISVRATDSITSRLSGAIGLKCITPKFICSKGSAKIFGLDLSYGFSIKNTKFGFGPLLKFKWNDEYPEILGKKDVLLGLGGIILHNFEKFGVSFGSIIFSSQNILKEKIPLGGGIGSSVFTDDIFVFGQAIYFSKLLPSFGLTARALKWFRVGLSYSSNPIISAGFVSPRLYLWVGYSFNRTFLSSIGLVF